MQLWWSDADEIGYQLCERHPQTDPLTVRFTDLHRWVVELDGFADDPTQSTEGRLEEIQMAWLDYARDR